MLETEIRILQRKRTDLGSIQGQTEQNFFRFLQDRLPESLIEYEPQEFRAPVRSNGKRSVVRGTTPDYRIVKPDGTEVFVEITLSPKRGKAKQRQRKIMEHFPVRYTVLYIENLRNVEKAHGVEIVRQNGNGHKHTNGNGRHP